MWRKVQVERPRRSTSGGQFGGRVVGGSWAVAVVDGVVDEDEDVRSEGCAEEEGGGAFCCFVMAAQAPKEVHDRHL